MPTLMDVLLGELKSLANEIALLLPKIFVAILITLVAVAAVKGLNRLIRWIFVKADIESFIERSLRVKFRFPLLHLTILVCDLGIALTALVAGVRIFVPEYLPIYSDLVVYAVKLISISVLILIFLLGLDVLIKVTTLEKRVESFFYILVFLFTLLLVTDLIALGPEIKHSLGMGIAIGMGITIGAFSAWIFFRDIMRKE